MDASAGSSPPPHSQENPPKHGGGRGKAPAGEIQATAAADDFVFAEDTFPSLPDFPCLSFPSFAAAGRMRGRAEGAAGEDDVLDELLNFATLSDTMPCWEDEPLFPDQVGMMIEDHGGAGNAASDEAAQDSSSPADDLPRFFMEWLTNNRDCISAEDLRSTRLRRSTIEAAAARLGGGRQGTMQLLKLILTWVQNHHLQKKRPRIAIDELPSPGYDFPMPYQQAYGAAGQYPFQQSGSTSQPFSPPAPVAGDMQAWPQQYAAFPGAAPYPMLPPQPLAAAGFGLCAQPMAGVEPSASKEARKKRMAWRGSAAYRACSISGASS